MSAICWIFKSLQSFYFPVRIMNLSRLLLFKSILAQNLTYCTVIFAWFVSKTCSSCQYWWCFGQEFQHFYRQTILHNTSGPIKPLTGILETFLFPKGAQCFFQYKFHKDLILIISQVCPFSDLLRQKKGFILFWN